MVRRRLRTTPANPARPLDDRRVTSSPSRCLYLSVSAELRAELKGDRVLAGDERCQNL